MRKTVGFAFYYVSLRCRVLLGTHRTPNPLGISWRWRHYRHSRAAGRNRPLL